MGIYGIVLLLLALVLLPVASAFIPDRNTGYEPGLVSVSVGETDKEVEPGAEAVFEARLKNNNPFPVFIHMEVIIPPNSSWQTSINRNDFFLDAAASETIYITLKAPGDARNGTQASAILLVNAGEDSIEEPNKSSRMLNAMVVESNSGNFMALAVVASGSFILLAAAGYLGSSESGKYSLLLFFLPLYSRIHKDKVLEHSTREGIYSYIKLHPGVNFTRIKEEFELTNGTLLHHLKTLNRERYIKSCRTGLYRRFYPWGMKIQMESTLTGPQKAIYKLVSQCEGICQTDIAQQMGTSRQTVNHHIKALVELELITLERVGRKTGCFLTKHYHLENN